MDTNVAAKTVTCALCGAKMSADTQYCPKCGSLNAHYTYTKSPAAMKGPEVVVETTRPAEPEAVPPADITRPRRWRAPAKEQEQGNAPSAAGEIAGQAAWQYGPPPAMGAQEQNMPGMAAPTDLQIRPDIDLDVGVPIAGRDGVIHARPRVLPQLPAEARARRAYALEMFGFLGYLGIGHIYAGRRWRGVLLMIGWWVMLGIFFPPFIRNINLMSFMIFVLMLSVGPILSGYWIRKELRQEIGRGRRF